MLSKNLQKVQSLGIQSAFKSNLRILGPGSGSRIPDPGFWDPDPADPMTSLPFSRHKITKRCGKKWFIESFPPPYHPFQFICQDCDPCLKWL